MTVSCPICEAVQIAIFHNYGKFTLLNCKSCDLLFQDQVNQVNIKELVTQVYDLDWVAMRDQYLEYTFLEHAAFNTLLLGILAPNKGDLLTRSALPTCQGHSYNLATLQYVCRSFFR